MVSETCSLVAAKNCYCVKNFGLLHVSIQQFADYVMRCEMQMLLYSMAKQNLLNLETRHTS